MSQGQAIASDTPTTGSTIRWNAGLVLLGLAAAWFYSQFSLSHDNSWYLIATRRFMEGARLYVDIVEINPPLAFYLTVPGLALADISSLSDKAGYVAYIAALSTISSIWSASLAWRSTLDANQKFLLAAAVPILLIVLPISEFGQREHLLLILTAPYFIAAILDERVGSSRGEQLLMGSVAALGLALKPYFYLAPLALYIVKSVRARSLAPSFCLANWAIALITIGYVFFIWLTHPEYVNDIVPMARSVYHSYGMEIWRRIAQPPLLAIPIIGVLLGSARSEDRRIATDITAVAAGFLASYFVQFKGWNYHILPAAAYLLLAIAWLTVGQASRLRASIPLSVLTMLGLLGTLGQQLIRGPYNSKAAQAFEAFVPQKGMSILVLTSNVSHAFPFVNEVEATWASRYPTQWLVPGALNVLRYTDCIQEQDRCDRARSVLETARSDVIADMVRYRPDLVLIDERATKSHFQGIEFEYLEFLSEDPAFQELWTHFDVIGTQHGYVVYQANATVEAN